MARMISIYVDFKQRSYMALVLVHEVDGQVQFCEVSFRDDEDFDVVLPNNSMVFDMRNGLKPPEEPSDTSVGDLVANTMTALRGSIDIGSVNCR